MNSHREQVEQSGTTIGRAEAANVASNLESLAVFAASGNTRLFTLTENLLRGWLDSETRPESDQFAELIEDAIERQRRALHFAIRMGHHPRPMGVE